MPPRGPRSDLWVVVVTTSAWGTGSQSPVKILPATSPGMRQRHHGTIITMSSAAVRRPTPQSPLAYAAAKAAIELLTKELAAQAGPDGIRVNCIAPETILTERNQQQIPEAIQEKLRHSHPIQRLGTPDDVAHAALFLASDHSSWISGTTLASIHRLAIRGSGDFRRGLDGIAGGC